MLIIRLVNPEAAALKAVPVVPAPKISSLDEAVVAEPLFAAVPVPVPAAVTSSGFVVSAPLYSSTRTSGYAAA